MDVLRASAGGRRLLGRLQRAAFVLVLGCAHGEAARMSSSDRLDGGDVLGSRPPRVLIARRDATLGAVLIARRPLVYVEGADITLDRPPHVRAASGITPFGGRLAVIQDDANLVAWVDPTSHETTSFLLPPGKDGKRVFEDARGTKAWKLDFEACTSFAVEGAEVLLAFGSGSTERREKVLIAKLATSGGEPEITLRRARLLYEEMRATSEFSGSELNIEGVVSLEGGIVRFFQRGNGAPRRGMLPVNATADVSRDALLAHLWKRRRNPPPRLENVIQYDLGDIDGVRFTFSDAAASRHGVLYIASAETSPDATHDGPVAGIAIGFIEGSGNVRYTLITDHDGRPISDKAEGITLDPAHPGRVLLVVDADDPTKPSELLTVDLTGRWGA